MADYREICQAQLAALPDEALVEALESLREIAAYHKLPRAEQIPLSVIRVPARWGETTVATVPPLC